MSEKPSKQARRSFQSPKGTRDFYPEEMLRRRYIVDSWRRVALRHGFEEIDGPTFEHLDLYTVKSGEGIVSELFSFQRAGGEDVYALRPEFTPTLARMYAARARQLPKPTRWFSIAAYFRAERPQRGRLREFLQWNVDVIGLPGDTIPPDELGPKNEIDAELIGVCANALSEYGADSSLVRMKVNSRSATTMTFQRLGIPSASWEECFRLLDKSTKIGKSEFQTSARSIGLSEEAIVELSSGDNFVYRFGDRAGSAVIPSELERQLREKENTPGDLFHEIPRAGVSDWSEYDGTIVRGLAYYTGTVFEATAAGERAVAGGGRYDNLIELMGGDPTPASGFAMGDVVLANLLDDRGLMPSGREMLEALSRPMPLRPDAFVVSADSDEARGAVVPLVARLRRGEEAEDWRKNGAKPWAAERYTVPPLHARRTYKQTKNIGKLLADASACHARYAVIVENPERCTLKDLDRGEQREGVPIDAAGRLIAGV